MSDNTHYSDTFPRSELFAGIATKKQADILSRGHRIVFKSGRERITVTDPHALVTFAEKG